MNEIETLTAAAKDAADKFFAARRAYDAGEISEAAYDGAASEMRRTKAAMHAAKDAAVSPERKAAMAVAAAEQAAVNAAQLAASIRIAELDARATAVSKTTAQLDREYDEQLIRDNE